MRQRTFLLWTTVEQRKERETAAWRVAAAENGLAGSGPYEAHLLAAQSGLENDDEMLVQAEQEILKDVKRTFPWLENYGEREAATRNVLLAYAFRNPSVGYCQSLNYICGALLMVPLSEEDTFFSLCTLVEDMMPPDYYSAEHDILGARVDQLVFASVLLKELPRLASHLLELQWLGTHYCGWQAQPGVPGPLSIYEVLHAALKEATGIAMLRKLKAKPSTLNAMKKLKRPGGAAKASGEGGAAEAENVDADDGLTGKHFDPIFDYPMAGAAEVDAAWRESATRDISGDVDRVPSTSRSNGGGDIIDSDSDEDDDANVMKDIPRLLRVLGEWASMVLLISREGRVGEPWRDQAIELSGRATRLYATGWQDRERFKTADRIYNGPNLRRRI